MNKSLTVATIPQQVCCCSRSPVPHRFLPADFGEVAAVDFVGADVFGQEVDAAVALDAIDGSFSMVDRAVMAVGPDQRQGGRQRHRCEPEGVSLGSPARRNSRRLRIRARCAQCCQRRNRHDFRLGREVSQRSGFEQVQETG